MTDELCGCGALRVGRTCMSGCNGVPWVAPCAGAALPTGHEAFPALTAMHADAFVRPTETDRWWAERYMRNASAGERQAMRELLA